MRKHRGGRVTKNPHYSKLHAFRGRAISKFGFRSAATRAYKKRISKRYKR